MKRIDFRYVSAVLFFGNVLLAVSAVYYHGVSLRNWRDYAGQRILNGRQEMQIRELQDEVETLRRKLASGSESRQVERLQRDLAKLNEILDMREQEIGQLEANKMLKEQQKSRAEKKSASPAPRRTYQDYMENLRKENPERYQKIRARMDEIARQKKQLLEKREHYFAGLNKEKMTEEQRTLVGDYLTLIQLNEDLIQENNPENRKDIWQNNRLLMQMQEGIRDVLLQQEFGDGGKADRVREIYEITSPRAVFGSMGRFRHSR